MFKKEKVSCHNFKFTKRGFTLIELIVVMAIIGILVLLAMPKFMGYTEKARLTEMKANIKQLENASERYYIDKNDWPRLNNEPYTSEEIEAFAQQVKDKTGQVVILDENGNYFDIDYNKLQRYVQKPKDDIHYIIQNPVGEIYYLDKLTDTGKDRVSGIDSPSVEEPSSKIVKMFGGDKQDTLTSATATADGGFVVVGYSNSTNGDFAGFNLTSRDSVIAKFNADGNREWVKTIGGSGNDEFFDVKQTSDGGYIVVGSAGSMDGDFVGIGHGSNDALIVKYDSNGNRQWIKDLGGSFMDVFYAVEETTNGDFVAVGISSSSDGTFAPYKQGKNDLLIVKFNSTGTMTNVKMIGGTNSNDSFKSVKRTTDGNFIGVGYSSSNNRQFTGLNNGGQDAFIMKFDISGNPIWINNIGGSGTEEFRIVKQTLDGGYIAVGTSGSMDYDFTNLNHGSNDSFIVKFDSIGNIKWINTIGGSSFDSFNDVHEISDGYIAVGASASSDGDLADLNNDIQNATIVKFDINGNKELIKLFGGNASDGFVRILKLNTNKYILVGGTSSTDGYFNGLSYGGGDGFFLITEDILSD